MKYFFITLLIVGLLLACSAVKINVDSKGDAEYIRFETFGWLKSGAQIANYNRIDNQKTEIRIYELIKQIMTEKGYEFIEDGDPDILVTFYAGVKGDVISDESGYTYGKWFEGNNEIKQDGLLLIDLIDNENRILFWRGKGSGLLDDPEDADKVVQKICARIFSDFPDRSDK